MRSPVWRLVGMMVKSRVSFGWPPRTSFAGLGIRFIGRSTARLESHFHRTEHTENRAKTKISFRGEAFLNGLLELTTWRPYPDDIKDKASVVS